MFLASLRQRGGCGDVPLPDLNSCPVRKPANRPCHDGDALRRYGFEFHTAHLDSAPLLTHTRRRGCTAITLTTLGVEAPGFYKEQGYDIAATIDCDPRGLTRYYMMKKL